MSGRNDGRYCYPARECLGRICPKDCLCWRSPGDGETIVSPFLKYTLFFVNFLFWLGSLALIIIGSWALATKQLDGSARITSAWTFVFDVTIIFIIVGCLAFFLATAGCIGALRENVCLLRTYWITLSIVALTLVIIAIVGLSMWGTFTRIAKETMSKQLILSYNDDPDLKDLLDFTQEEFQCCGISDRSYADWKDNIYFNCTPSNKAATACGVPFSCCRKEAKYGPSNSSLVNYNCGFGVQLLSIPEIIQAIYPVGCVKAIEDSISHNILLFCLVSLGISLLPVVGIFLAIALSNQISDQTAMYNEEERRRRRIGPQYIVTRA